MTTPDPLLPLPDEPLNLSASLSPEERLEAVLVAVIDHVNFHAMAWPARDSTGALVAPPAQHVLHELAHAYDLVDEERLMSSPRLNNVYVAEELPNCDFCTSDARYDAMVVAEGTKGGAYMCIDHYSQFGSGTLGASGDTYLMLVGEVPAWVKNDCNQLLATQGRKRIF